MHGHFAYLAQKREQKMCLVDLFGLLHLARVEDRAQRLGSEFFRGTVHIDATEK